MKVILTFDDSLKTHFDLVFPILEKYGFNATFFTTTTDELFDNDPRMSTEEMKILHDEGFEIANHSYHHRNMPSLNEKAIRENILRMEDFLDDLDIVKPVTYCYPGYSWSYRVRDVLESLGYKFARIGYTQTSLHFNPHKRTKIFYYPYEDCDNLLLRPTGILNITYGYGLDSFVKDLTNTPEGKAAIFVAHGFSDPLQFEEFKKITNYLHEHKEYEVVALRDLI